MYYLNRFIKGVFIIDLHFLKYLLFMTCIVILARVELPEKVDWFIYYLMTAIFCDVLARLYLSFQDYPSDSEI